MAQMLAGSVSSVANYITVHKQTQITLLYLNKLNKKTKSAISMYLVYHFASKGSHTLTLDKAFTPKKCTFFISPICNMRNMNNTSLGSPLI